MKLNKIKLAMMIFNIWSNTKTDSSLEQFITKNIYSEEFEAKARDGLFSLATNHKHIKILVENGVLEVVKKARGGQGIKIGAIYRFNPTFKELCLNKDDLIDTLKEML